MSHVEQRLQYAKEYYQEKLKQGRTDPIAKMLLGTLERQITQLEKEYAKEKAKSYKKNALSCPRERSQHLRKALHRLRNYYDRGLCYVCSLVNKERPSCAEVVK